VSRQGVNVAVMLLKRRQSLIMIVHIDRVSVTRLLINVPVVNTCDDGL